MPPKTRKDLDSARCQNPGCTHTDHGPIVLSPGCHRGAPMRVVYNDGVLTVTCFICDALVQSIVVGNTPPPGGERPNIAEAIDFGSRMLDESSPVSHEDETIYELASSVVALGNYALRLEGSGG